MAADQILAELGNLVLALDGAGMELTERPFGRGARLRVWMPDVESVREVGRLAHAAGLFASVPGRHLDHAGALAYNGWQLVIEIPTAVLLDARRALATARGEIGPATKALPRGDRDA